MRRLSIYSTKNNRKKILEFLQEIGAMEIDEIQSDDIPFEKMDTSGERIRFQKIADEFDHVIETLSYNLNTIKINVVLDKMGFPINWRDLADIERSQDLDEEK